jgi:hypothetical protein
MTTIAAQRIAFRVRRADKAGEASLISVIVLATTREFAAHFASPLLGGDPNAYEVEPVTNKGEYVTFLLFT